MIGIIRLANKRYGMLYGMVFQSRDDKLYLEVPVYGTDGGYVVLIADAIGEQPVPYLPGEHGRILLLVVGDRVYYLWCRHLRLAATDHAGFDGTRLVVPKNRKKKILNFFY